MRIISLRSFRYYTAALVIEMFPFNPITDVFLFFLSAS